MAASDLHSPPTCPTHAFRYVYAAKFLCGEWPPQERFEGPVQPGRYSTAINVHNPNGHPLDIRKKAILLFDGSRPQDALERPIPPARTEDPVLRQLGPDWGLEIDCRDIRETLLGGAQGSFIKGWVVIETLSDAPLDVVAVYTVAPLVEGERQTPSIATDRVLGHHVRLPGY